MKSITRLATILLFLFAAIVCYAIGLPRGTLVFIVLGVIFEGLFWVGLFNRKKNQ
jgi:hypothetical protein